MAWGASIFSRYNDRLGLPANTQWSGKMSDAIDYLNQQKANAGQVTPGTSAATPLNSTTYAPGQAIPQVPAPTPAPNTQVPVTPSTSQAQGTQTVAQIIAGTPSVQPQPAIQQPAQTPANQLALGQFAPATAPVTGPTQTQTLAQPMPIAANQMPEPASVANMLTPGAPQPYTQAYPGATYPQNTLFSDKRLKKNIKGMKC